jgi:hypothetical protein
MKKLIFACLIIVSMASLSFAQMGGGMKGDAKGQPGGAMMGGQQGMMMSQKEMMGPMTDMMHQMSATMEQMSGMMKGATPEQLKAMSPGCQG